MVRLDDIDGEDRTFLRDVVERHGELTGSAVAARLLADWDAALGSFRKVLPLDYERVLTVLRDARASGLDETETMQKVMEASHG
jgi:glutamate synthase (NADPH/NADH) large chain